jgi:phenylalanyl-tRNA synthetase alpha chain
MTTATDLDLETLVQEARERFATAHVSADLENAKAQFLGKAGRITELMKALAKLPLDQKKSRGASINQAKQAIEVALTQRRQQLVQAQMDAQLAQEALDITLPGRWRGAGGLHPVTLAWERIIQIFVSMGFDVADGPEIDTDWFNFTALGNPPDHPARSMQDTFYVDMQDESGQPYCLRTHTSTMQLRYCIKHAKLHAQALARGDIKEIKAIAPGRTYRVDNDATHSPMFHQFEGLWLGRNISLKDLKVTYLNFCKAFFQTDDLLMRFRPSYFPFTEPSAEIDIQFKSGPLANKWLEVSGSGMMRPSVFRNAGLDPELYQGFAFGSGIDRLAMLRYGVSDLRPFFESDVRFIAQFN